MTKSLDATPHLDDAELARLLDDEHAPDERARWDAHVASCAQCTDEVERLRADAATVRVWLERAAFEQVMPRDVVRTRDDPRHAAVAPWLRVAAAIALIALPVTALAAMPAVRAWVAAAIADLRGGDAAVMTSPEPAAPAATPGDRIRFVPAAGNFIVIFDAAQEDGTVRIAHGSEPSAALDRDGTPTVVAESMLRIRNTTSSSRSYVLEVPVTVTSVAVRIGARTIAQLDAAALRAGVELPVRLR